MAVNLNTPEVQLSINRYRVGTIFISVKTDINSSPYIKVQWEAGNVDAEGNWTYVKPGMTTVIRDIEELVDPLTNEVIIEATTDFTTLGNTEVIYNGDTYTIYDLMSKLLNEYGLAKGFFSGSVD